MSSDIAIRVEGLSKRYLLQKNAKSEGLRHVIQGAISDPIRRIRAVFDNSGNKATASNHSEEPSAEQKIDEFWALKDVSFEIKRGEVLGIIGRNGAGKSTLLKILSRITEPTSGRIEIDGRVASLLEVGTGFHPELTGRENIFLNGAILGMSRSEVLRKFDEIVAFSGVERFMDTPVKRYSSGMYVRLAFSVAAHLEPDILIVDEVLAVGDAEFQKKCLGKIHEVSTGGRTVLVVSHSVAAVQNLCSMALLLRSGGIAAIGGVTEVLGKYFEESERSVPALLSERKDRQGGQLFRFTAIELGDSTGKRTEMIPSGSGLSIEITFQCEVAVCQPVCFLGIYDGRGTQIAHFNTALKNAHIDSLPMEGRIRCCIPALPLNTAQYHINIAMLSEGRMLDRVERAATFSVVEADVYETGKQLQASEGYLMLNHQWEYR